MSVAVPSSPLSLTAVATSFPLHPSVAQVRVELIASTKHSSCLKLRKQIVAHEASLHSGKLFGVKKYSESMLLPKVEIG